MSRYAPRTGFSSRLAREFRRIAAALSEVETDTVLLKQWNAAPSKTYDGMIAYADGTNWNPGSGQGVYVYRGGSWNLLG